MKSSMNFTGTQHPVHEEEKRMQRFLKRNADVQAHNLHDANKEESFSRKHTFSSDLVDGELEKVPISFVPRGNADISLTDRMNEISVAAKPDRRNKSNNVFKNSWIPKWGVEGYGKLAKKKKRKPHRPTRKPRPRPEPCHLSALCSEFGV